MSALPVVVAATMLVLELMQPKGLNFQQQQCRLYCEGSHDCKNLERIPIQPVNTYSNIVYLLVGLVVFVRRRTVMRAAFAGACGLLFAGSAWFHATLARQAQFMDEIGMYAVGSFLAAYAVFTTETKSPSGFVTPAALLVALPLALFAEQLDSVRVLVVTSAVIVAYMILEVVRGEQPVRQVLIIAGLFGGGLLLRQLGVSHVLCDPTSPLQLHAAWHLLTGIGIYKVYRFFSSVRDPR